MAWIEAGMVTQLKKIFTYSWMLKHERKAMQNHISLHVLFFKKLEI